MFVDYDNIYLSLKRKNEDAAKRFAKDSAVWLQGIASGELITSTNSYSLPGERRIAMNRCYGNPVPRRNAHDNSTDMNSFPFIRHHFLRAGFEVIDCPPLTAQLKNSADIRMVMDVRDILNHDTYFDEFIILSGDADFTPLLHRLRAHARRTVVFANDHTAQPYTAISDGEIRELNLITLLTSGNRAISGESPREIRHRHWRSTSRRRARPFCQRSWNSVRVAPQAVPLETLADRAVRVVGRDKTVGTNWGGYGSFRDLLLADLPEDIHLSDTAPYTVFDGNRHISAAGLIAPQQLAPPVAEQRRPEPARAEPQQAALSAPLSAPARIAQPATSAAIPQSAYHSPVPQSRYIDRGTPAAPPAPPMPTSRMPELTAVAPAAPQALTRSVGAQAPGAAALQPRRQPVAPPPASYRPEPRRELARPQS